MDFVEFAEKISPIPLTDWQKQFLLAYEQAQKENRLFICMPARINGRNMLARIIREFERRAENDSSKSNL